ncbi:MAG: hypothetical protein FWF46_05120, partial [Oscillospiraceae bacterium]|nr:hypothetical protein [Oscillospiraceae bacterium]
TNVIKVYYVKRTDLSYTVEYYYDGKIDNSKTDTFDNQTFGTVVSKYTDKVIDGYTLDSDTAPITVGTDTNVIKVYYVKRTDLSYTVEYYYDGTIDNSKTDTFDNQTFGTVVSKYTDKVIDGYTLDRDTAPITIGTGTNVINVYYIPRTDLSYTVEYYYDGVLDANNTDTFNNQTFGTVISDYKDKVKLGYKFDSATAPITIGVTDNVIKVYYVQQLGEINVTSKLWQEEEFTEEVTHEDVIYSQTANTIKAGDSATIIVNDSNGNKIATIVVVRDKNKDWEITCTLEDGVTMDSLDAVRTNSASLTPASAFSAAGITNTTNTLFSIPADGSQLVSGKTYYFSSADPLSGIGGTGNDAIYFRLGSVTITKTVEGTGVYKYTEVSVPEDTFKVKISGTTLLGEQYEKIVDVPKGGNLTFDGVPYGTYTVTELDNEGNPLAGYSVLMNTTGDNPTNGYTPNSSITIVVGDNTPTVYVNNINRVDVTTGEAVSLGGPGGISLAKGVGLSATIGANQIITLTSDVSTPAIDSNTPAIEETTPVTTTIDPTADSSTGDGNSAVPVEDTLPVQNQPVVPTTRVQGPQTPMVPTTPAVVQIPKEDSTPAENTVDTTITGKSTDGKNEVNAAPAGDANDGDENVVVVETTDKKDVVVTDSSATDQTPVPNTTE